MIKFLLIIAVITCASVTVESVASSTFKEFCDAKFKLVEDLPIKSYIVSRLPGKPNVYIRTDVNNGVYQIEYNVGGDAKLIHQQQLIQEFAWNSFTAGQPINLCVDASTTPSTIHMIEGGYGLKVVDVKPVA